MYYCKALRFEDRPDYVYLKQTLRDLLLKKGHDYDFMFDWTILDIVFIVITLLFLAQGIQNEVI